MGIVSAATRFSWLADLTAELGIDFVHEPGRDQRVPQFIIRFDAVQEGGTHSRFHKMPQKRERIRCDSEALL